MATQSVIGPIKAGSHYLQQPINVLTVLATGYYFAGRVSPYMGWNVPAWVSKVNDASFASFTIYEIGKVLSTPSAIIRDGKAAYDVIWGGESAEDVRDARNGDFPRDDNSLGIGPKIWTTYRLAATSFKFVSSGLVIYSVLKTDANLSPALKLAGPALGGAAHLIDILDRESKIRDFSMDVADKNIPAQGMIKNPQAGDEDLLTALLPMQWRMDQLISLTFFAMKAVVFTLAIKEMANCDSLIGRVCQLVKTHENDIWGGLFIATLGTTAWQHINYGATIQELKNRNINKKS